MIHINLFSSIIAIGRANWCDLRACPYSSGLSVVHGLIISHKTPLYQPESTDLSIIECTSTSHQNKKGPFFFPFSLLDKSRLECWISGCAFSTSRSPKILFCLVYFQLKTMDKLLGLDRPMGSLSETDKK